MLVDCRFALRNPMDYTTLVTLEELHARLHDPNWIVFDCRHDLADTEAGRRAYLTSHLPGARFVHLDEDLSAPKTGTNGRHPLPDPAQFCARLNALGMTNDKQAVAYDSAGGPYAARLWWMLRWVGHSRAAVLDGGWDAWLRRQFPVTPQSSAVTAGGFKCTLRERPVDATFILNDASKAGVRVLDARSADRFRGDNETLDPVAGHIPGALNRFFKDNLASDGRFKPAAQLRHEFSQVLGATPAAQIVHQCGSGVTACHNLLAMEIAGLNGSRLYPGSWSEWCSDPRRPVATGPAA